MDELYVESFSKREVVTTKVVDIQPVEEKPIVEVYEFKNQMHYHLDQLELMITQEFKDFTHFKFVFDRIKAKLKDDDIKSVLQTLFELEELIDLRLPLLALKSAIN